MYQVLLMVELGAFVVTRGGGYVDGRCVGLDTAHDIPWHSKVSQRCNILQ